MNLQVNVTVGVTKKPLQPCLLHRIAKKSYCTNVPKHTIRRGQMEQVGKGKKAGGSALQKLGQNILHFQN